MKQQRGLYLLVSAVFCIGLISIQAIIPRPPLSPASSRKPAAAPATHDPLPGKIPASHLLSSRKPAGKVVFFDDFSGKQLDRSKWNAEVTGMHVNRELQAYVDSNATIYLENNTLVLRPLYSSGFTTKDGQKFDFISGRINTKSKFDFKYGTAEARIKISDGAGLWPAWWMLGNGPWPETGEVDIMEYVGEKAWASAAVHGPGYSGGKGLVDRFNFTKGNDITRWHVYGVDWTPDSLVFKYDGIPMFRVTKSMTAQYGKWAFDNNKYLILNFAVGGVYPAKVNGIEKPYYGLAPATLDQIKNNKTKMWVDWVKVTQR